MSASSIWYVKRVSDSLLVCSQCCYHQPPYCLNEVLTDVLEVMGSKYILDIASSHAGNVFRDSRKKQTFAHVVVVLSLSERRTTIEKDDKPLLGVHSRPQDGARQKLRCLPVGPMAKAVNNYQRILTVNDLSSFRKWNKTEDQNQRIKCASRGKSLLTVSFGSIDVNTFPASDLCQL